jgi:hypothetical protein
MRLKSTKFTFIYVITIINLIFIFNSCNVEVVIGQDTNCIIPISSYYQRLPEPM